jgi:GNAT superfamily N-acetyltransferase
MTAVISPFVNVDLVRGGDRTALERLLAGCSQTTVIRRFFAPLRRFPASYLESVLAGRPAEHDAVVLRYGDGLHVAGLASFVAVPDGRPLAGELGVLVQDGWQGRGLGAAMVRVLLRRAVDRGVEEVAASVLPDRAGLLFALGRRLELLAVAADVDYLTGRYRIPEEVAHDDDPPRTA